MSTKRKDITRAGSRVFPRSGYTGTTVDEILREANVARSTFYVYFPNKRELFKSIVEAVNRRILSRVEQVVDSVIEQYSVPEESWPRYAYLEHGFIELMKDVFGYITMNSGMTLMFTSDIPRVDDELTQMLKDLRSSMKEQFERVVSFGKGIGLLRKVDERLSAEFIVGGVFNLAASVVSDEILYDLDNISRQFVELHLRGLLKDDKLLPRDQLF